MRSVVSSGRGRVRRFTLNDSSGSGVGDITFILFVGIDVCSNVNGASLVEKMAVGEAQRDFDCLWEENTAC